MKGTQMPQAQSANLAANRGNTICGVGVICDEYNPSTYDTKS